MCAAWRHVYPFSCPSRDALRTKGPFSHLAPAQPFPTKYQNINRKAKRYGAGRWLLPPAPVSKWVSLCAHAHDARVRRSRRAPCTCTTTMHSAASAPHMRPLCTPSLITLAVFILPREPPSAELFFAAAGLPRTLPRLPPRSVGLSCLVANRARSSSQRRNLARCVVRALPSISFWGFSRSQGF